MELITKRVGEGSSTMKKHYKKRVSAKLPKGAYRLPNSNYVTRHRDPERERNITVTAVHNDPPDNQKLARAFLYLAQQLAEADAQRAVDRQSRRGRRVQ